MRLHLVDGTYELFRAFFGAPSATAPDGREVGATRGLLRSFASLVRGEGATHVGIAFDHVISSEDGIGGNRNAAGWESAAGIHQYRGFACTFGSICGSV